jgi:hypothetical protein
MAAKGGCWDGWLGRLLGVLKEMIVLGCNVNRGYLWRAWAPRADWCSEGRYIGSSLAYLIVKGS